MDIRNKVTLKLQKIFASFAEEICSTIVRNVEDCQSLEDVIEYSMYHFNDGDFQCDFQEIVKQMAKEAWPYQDELLGVDEDDEDETFAD